MAYSIAIPSHLNTTSLSVTLKCWEQKLHPEPQLTPVTYIDCKQAIGDIPVTDKFLAPLSFGRDPDAGFTVPYTWAFGGCAVKIDVLREDDKEISTFAAILKRAFDIAVACVIKPPHLGGEGLVGANERLTVLVYGLDAKVPSLGLVESNLSVSVVTS